MIESQRPDAANPVPASGVFVGRVREYNELRAGVADAIAGRGGLFMLAGEPGIGKTRLADEVTTYARGQGARVLWGRCWEGEGAPVFWPWLQMIRAYVQHGDAASLRAEMGSGAAAIAQVMPEVCEYLPDTAAARPLEPAQARFRLFDSVTTFLKNAAARRPLVLILDDLHSGDESSILLLHFLARQLRDACLLVVGTYRDVEVGTEHPLAEALGVLGRENRCIELRGLGAEDVARFIQGVTGAVPAASLVEAVYERTEGNPFFVSEVVRLLDAEGKLPYAVADVSWQLSIPHGVRDTVRRRLKRLSPSCHALLTCAAVIGREFGIDVLERMVVSEPALAAVDRPLLQLLEESMAPRLVVAVPRALGRYRFAHALVRETLYDEAPATRRAALHGRVGTALEQLYAANPEPHLAELAHHFFEAARGGGDAHKAVEYARRAGERATAQLAYEEAVTWNERALQAVALEQPSDERTHCALMVALGETQVRRDEAQFRGDGDLRPRETLTRAADLARKLGAADLLARTALAFGGTVIGTRFGIFDSDLVRLLEEALAALGDGDSLLRARVLARLATAVYWSNLRERGDALSREAVDMARRLGHRATLAYALNHRRAALWGPEAAEQRFAVSDEIVQIAESTGDRAMEMTGRIWRIVDLMEMGDMRRINMEFDVFTRLARDLAVPQWIWWATTFRALRAQLGGRLDEAERFVEEATSLGYAAESTDAIQALGSLMHTLRKEQGRIEELEPILRNFADQYPTIPGWRTALADLYSNVGRTTEARREFEGLAANDFADLPADQNWMPALACLAEACAFLGDAQRAATLYRLMQPYARRFVVVGTANTCLGPVSRYLGLLATTMLQWDQAARYFEDALDMSRGLGARTMIAHTQHDYARMLLAQAARPSPAAERAEGSDPGTAQHQRALELLTAAIAAYDELKMESYLKKAIALRDGGRPSGGDNGAARVDAVDVPRHQSPSAECVFRKDGGYWEIQYVGTAVRLKDNKGLQYIAWLLRHPGEQFHVGELVAVAERPSPETLAAYSRVSDAQLAEEHLHLGALGGNDAPPDTQARSEYRRRLQWAQEQLDEAERFHDTGRATRAREEIDLISGELGLRYGMGSHPQRSGPIERARKAVTNRIRDAMGHIQRAHPVLWQHFSTSISTGSFCSYRPDQPMTWKLW